MSNIENITFGVEIETTIPASAGILVGGYHRGLPIATGNIGGVATPAPTFNGAKWKAEADGSIVVTRPGHIRCEFVSPVLRGEAGVRHLMEFLKFLRGIGATVNRSCGMHIHVGVTGAAGGTESTQYIERLTRLVSYNSRALYAQTGTVLRERALYCRPLGDGTKKAVAKLRKTKRLTDAAATNRYQLLNLVPLPTQGTVEFRCFAATLNTTKALLHIFSVLVLCLVARNAKTPATWDNRPLTGAKAISNLLKVRPVTRIVGASVFETAFPAMLEKALEMATKYDGQTAAADLAAMVR